MNTIIRYRRWHPYCWDLYILLILFGLQWITFEYIGFSEPTRHTYAHILLKYLKYIHMTEKW